MPPRKRKSDQGGTKIHEDPVDEYKPLSLAAVAQMGGWWPGMGAVLLPKDGNASKETTLRVRSTKSIERELVDNFADADSAAHGFCMISGGQMRFLQAVAEIENKKCREKKRKGPKHQIKDYLDENFPALHYGQKYKPTDTDEPHLTEKLLGHDKKTGKPDVEIRIRWSPTEIRSKVQKLLQAPGSKLTIADLCQQMETTQEEYCEFMKKKELHNGPVPLFHLRAAYYFAKKDEGLVPIDQKTSKKRKSSSRDDGDDDEGEGESGGGAGHGSSSSSSNKKSKTSSGESKASSEVGGKAGSKTNNKADGNDKPKTKKQLKEEENALYDVSDVRLPEYADKEADGKVPVFETCDTVRKMIKNHLKQCKHRTKADFLRSLSDQLPPSGTKKNLQSVQLTRFESERGPCHGAATSCFYAAYLFFEKLRIKQGKRKSEFRLEMERKWGPNGMDRDDDSTGWAWLGPGETMDDKGRTDKYGVWIPSLRAYDPERVPYIEAVRKS